MKKFLFLNTIAGIGLFRPGKLFLYLLLTGLFSCDRNPLSLPEKDNKDYITKAEALYQTARPYFNSGNDTLNSIATKLILLGIDNQDTSIIVTGKIMKAHYELRISNYPIVMKTALSALELAEKSGLLEKIPEIYSLIGNTYKENEYYRGAIPAARKELAAAKRLKDTTEIIGAMLNYAMFTHSYSMLKDDDSIAAVSLSLYLDGLQLARSSSRYERQQIAFLDNISQYYKLKKEYEKGIDYGIQGAELARKYGQKRSLTYSFNWLGEMYYYQGFYDKGMAYLDSALQYAKDLQWGFRVAEILGSKYQCYLFSGHPKKALADFVQSQNIRDSLQMLKNVRQVSLLQVQYEAGKKDQKIEMLSELNKEKTKETIGILAGLAVFVLLSVFLFSQYRTIKRKNRSLKESNDKINLQAQKLQILMKELHHRVKNNLQIVSSLLSLQSHHLPDKEAQQAVKTGQQRIEAMALIHRSLYEQAQPNMVDMQEYITGLTESILQSFGKDRTHINMQVNVEIKKLDVDMALPLGLIINEWMTNVFKYAFIEVVHPELFLSLKQDRQIALEIKDNGPGMNRAAWDNPQGSFGIKLIKVLSRQLDGKCEMDNSAGTRLRLHLPVKPIKIAV